MLKPHSLSDAPADATREIPHNFAIEQAVIGSVLLDNRVMDKIEWLQPEHYAEPLHQRMFEACRDLIEQGRKATALTIKDYMGADPDLKQQGGDGYLAKLVGSCGVIGMTAIDYARALVDLHCRRELIDIGEATFEDAFDPQGRDAGQMLTQLEDHVARVRAIHGKINDRKPSGLISADKYLTDSLNAATETTYRPEGETGGMMTGIREIDRFTAGLLPGNYMIIGARPSMGKSAFLKSVYYNEAKRLTLVNDDSVLLLFSPEVRGMDIMTVMQGYGTGIGQKQQRMNLTEEELDRLRDNAKLLRQGITKRLYIDESPIGNVTQIGRRARQIMRTKKIRCIAVDYLQRISGGPDGSRGKKGYEVMGEISRYLYDLAKELGVPLIALSQLSRGVEERDDKRPRMDDLRASGDLEQDADIVMLMYRAHYYLSKGAAPRMASEPYTEAGEERYQERLSRHAKELNDSHDKAEAIFGKVRHGDTGKADLFFDAPRQWFGSMQEKLEAEAQERFDDMR